MFDIQHNDGPIYGQLNMYTRTDTLGDVRGATAGWTLGIGSVSGSTTFETGLFAIDLTTSWNFKAGLLASASGNADNDSDFSPPCDAIVEKMSCNTANWRRATPFRVQRSAEELRQKLTQRQAVIQRIKITFPLIAGGSHATNKLDDSYGHFADRRH